MNTKTQRRLKNCGALVLLLPAFLLSCRSSPSTEPRSIIPADSLVFLETDDLGESIRVVTENPSFQKAADIRPDLQALNGIKLAMSVTGLDASEDSVADGAEVNIRPRFIIVAETGLWNFQAEAFAKYELGRFVDHLFGSISTLETSEKERATYHTWTTGAGRKAYALVLGSVIVFGNDEAAIDKCLSVRRGEAEPILVERSSGDNGQIAFGYVSPAGIERISDFAGISLALNATDDEDAMSFIARIVPDLLRNSVDDISWTAARDGDSIEDKIYVTLKPPLASALNKSMTTIEAGGLDRITRLVPSGRSSVTRYNLKDPQIAWRSLLLAAQQGMGHVRGFALAAFSGSVFEQYGIADGEMFLSSVSGPIVTVAFESDDDGPVVAARVADLERMKTSVSNDIDLSGTPDDSYGTPVWTSDDGEVAAALDRDVIILGGREGVLKCIRAEGMAASKFYGSFVEGTSAAATIGSGPNTATRLAKILGATAGNSPGHSDPGEYFTETKFTAQGIERRTSSDFGLIGWVIEQFGDQ
ncbi:MAG: hypothetical protein WBD22_15170 [Pyrinomonadaceae bacterium]